MNSEKEGSSEPPRRIVPHGRRRCNRHPAVANKSFLISIGDRTVGSLVRFCCMGAPIPRAMVRLAKEILPQMLVLGGWGQTENALVTLSRPGDPEDKIVETDGYPWPGMEIRTVGLAVNGFKVTVVVSVVASGGSPGCPT